MTEKDEQKKALYSEIAQYIEAHYEGRTYRHEYHFDEVLEQVDDDPFADIFKIFDRHHRRVKEILDQSAEEETFTECMLRLIEEKGLEESEVYHSVFLDRKLFNKIRNDREYHPSKRTALLIALALRLTLPETERLLAKAGFSLSHCSKTDLIVEYFISQGNYDIFEINEMLDAFHLPLLMKCE